MDQYLSSARLLLQPIVAAVSQPLGRPHGDTELILMSSLITLLLAFSVFLLLTLPGSGSLVSEPCCVTKLMQKRKAAKLPGEPIPSSVTGSSAPPNLEGFIRDVQQQLVSIRNEIQSLKSEREIVDHELIETSTQILQTIGATFGPVIEDDETELLELPTIVKPIPHRPSVDRPVIELTPAKQVSPLINPSIQHDSPVTQKSTSVVKPLILPNPEPQAPQSKAPAVPAAPQPKAPSQVSAAPLQPKPVVPVHNSASASIKLEPAPAQVNPAPKVVPKMSAIAAARLKREQELSESKAPPAQPGATNPFGKPKPGPFGGPGIAKLS